MRWILFPLVAAFGLAGCGSSPDGSSEADVQACDLAPAQIVSYIEEGLTITGGGSLASAHYVNVPSDLQNSAGWPEWLVAADLQGSGIEGGGDVAVWATSANDAPIMAVDGIAREFSDWGAAAQPGSPARDAMDALRGSDAYQTVVACAGG